MDRVNVTVRRLTVKILAVVACLAAWALPQTATAAPRSCGALHFDANRPEDNFYAVRVQAITCSNARVVLRRYRHAQASCIAGWTCAYNVRVAWTDRPRVKLAKGDRRIWFAIAQ